MVDHGKAVKPRFKTFSDKNRAETYARRKAIEKLDHGNAALAIPHAVSLEAARCLEQLNPYGATLSAATEYYIKHYLAFRDAPIIREICARLLNELRLAKRRARTVATVKTELDKFSARFGDRKLPGLTDQEVIDFVNETKNSMTRRKVRQKVGQLFRYAIRKKWTDHNPLEYMTLPTIEEKEPTIYSVDQVECLLRSAHSFKLLPYVILQCFCGIRREEVLRLDWSAFKWKQRIIRIEAGVAKRVAWRNAEINDTALAWLEHYKRLGGTTEGKVIKYANVDQPRRRLEKHCKVKHEDNALRHCFASYHFQRYGDPSRTAMLMGHTGDLRIFHVHYKVLVDPADAERYWALRT